MSRVQVGPRTITIHQGSTFMVTTESGEVAPGAELGLFCRDCRLVSSYRLLINGKPWTVATSAALSYYGSRFYLVSPKLRTAQETVKARKIALRLERTLDQDVREEFEITNHANRKVSFHFEIAIEADFADLFEVRSHRLVQRGQIDSIWDARRRSLEFRYRNRDFERGVIYRLETEQSEPHFANGRIRFDITLPPGGVWRSSNQLVPSIRPSERASSDTPPPSHAVSLNRLQQLWQDTTTKIATPNEVVQKTFDRARYDMGALRLYEHDLDETLWMPAAGVPWFVTLFGRDSLVAAYQNMLVNCRVALGTLHRLAEFQATKRDDWRDAQPGKILHEIRQGELAHFNLIPHGPYYGTADATILFLILLGEACDWTGEESVARDHRDTALRCLEWIDRHGDLDGDGFQEYKTFSPQGYHNMGWKDSGDAVVYPDGAQVDQPIATCELQGYVFDAKCRMAKLFDRLGESSTARHLRLEAEQLKARFNDTFWMEDEGFYAYALDPKKELVRSIASNPGHLLWSGIVDPPARARRVVQRLLQADMFSGWGVRTLSKQNPAYDPHAYQLGSVWPHDNAFIAAGAKRYGLWQEANQIAEAIFAACAAFQSYRPPELFSGLDRDSSGFPVQYIGANIPQAWASGSIFLLLRTILGITADAARKTLSIEPTLPDWLPEITLSNLRIGQHRVAIRFSGSGEHSRHEVLDDGGGVRIETRRH